MKFQRSNTTKTAFLLTALLGLGVTHVQPLLADELANVSDFKDCRAIKGEAERLLCYDTIADGGVSTNRNLNSYNTKRLAPRKRKRNRIFPLIS
jgi:hypothetical protein